MDINDCLVTRIIIYHVYIPVHVLSYSTLTSAHISSTTKFGPNSACLNPDYVNPVSFIGQIHVIALNQIKLCTKCHVVSFDFNTIPIVCCSKFQRKSCEWSRRKWLLSFCISFSQSPAGSSLELFSNQKSLNSQDSCDVKSAATQTLARKHTYIYVI